MLRDAHDTRTRSFLPSVTMTVVKTLVHLSDVQLGRDGETRRLVASAVEVLRSESVDHVVVTGNLTWSGRQAEWGLFEQVFAPLRAANRLTVVPGNRDRVGCDLACAIQPGPRVSVVAQNNLHLVRFDSTGPVALAVPRERARITDDDVDAIGSALKAAPPGKLVVLLMHHPVLPLMAEYAPERLLSWLAPRFEQERERGERLVETLRGRCDLVLHGQASLPARAMAFADGPRPLSMFGAGNSAELGRARVFWHESGRLLGPPAWMALSATAGARSTATTFHRPSASLSAPA